MWKIRILLLNNCFCRLWFFEPVGWMIQTDMKIPEFSKCSKMPRSCIQSALIAIAYFSPFTHPCIADGKAGCSI